MPCLEPPPVTARWPGRAARSSAQVLAQLRAGALFRFFLREDLTSGLKGASLFRPTRRTLLQVSMCAYLGHQRTNGDGVGGRAGRMLTAV
jgi:hypothetical protein